MLSSGKCSNSGPKGSTHKFIFASPHCEICLNLIRWIQLKAPQDDDFFVCIKHSRMFESLISSKFPGRFKGRSDFIWEFPQFPLLTQMSIVSKAFNISVMVKNAHSNFQSFFFTECLFFLMVLFEYPLCMTTSLGKPGVCAELGPSVVSAVHTCVLNQAWPQCQQIKPLGVSITDHRLSILSKVSLILGIVNPSQRTGPFGELLTKPSVYSLCPALAKPLHWLNMENSHR